MSETITKRLHVSGLTPSLTPADLSARFSSFGNVKSLDGFGLVDGVGNPRKFGYVTLEATPAALKRCLTALSGTTWKGAKLRIGEAKPDYRERIAQENSTHEPPQKRRRIHHSKYHAVLSPDLSLVTRENATKRPGWKVMPSGRIVRPMRMRPEKPLQPCVDQQKSTRPLKEKKRIKAPDTRARRRTIDVTKWGGTYLRGSLLDGQITLASQQPERTDEGLEVERGTGDDEDEVDQEDAMTPTDAPLLHTSVQLPHSEGDFARERSQNLHLLQALLGSDEWGDRESDSDIDETQVVEGNTPDDMDYEIVPVVHSESAVQQRRSSTPVSPPPETGAQMDVAHEPVHASSPPAPKVTSLKDLFKPQEDEGGFSLLNQLDLDLDEDLDAIFGPASVTPHEKASSAIQSAIPIVVPSVTSTKARTQQRIFLDPKTPLFFPLPASGSLQAKAADSPFYQTQTEEQIRQRWEENKVELTRGWKKRWREAVKVKRRRGGGKDGDGEV
ncbi:hypothetical protein VNI00_002424 [Paramarasmius palmivorus]|uniref:RRM domain-containing protein n=1 Tax=Paramarasmius palmivorus TaxID=297713 RepID=A0AAW0DYT0_9AGAR